MFLIYTVKRRKIIMKLSPDFSGIPTRYDDILKEIREAKLKQYYNQKAPVVKEGTYKLGDVFGDVLGKVLDKTV